MRLEPISGSYGRVTLTTGSIASVSSSALPIYSGEFYSVMVRASGSGAELVVKRADQGDIIESSDTVEVHPVVLNAWYSASYVNLGASGSFFGKPFTGMVDEFRMWGEVLTNDTFNLHVQYPGLYNGNTTISVRDSLYVRLSFNKPKSLGAAASVPLNNEAPSFKTQTFTAKNFPLISAFPYNMTVIERDVMRFSPNAGGSQFTTNKIIIADPPVLTYISGSSVPVLSRDKSIVSLADKKKRGQSTNTIGFYFSLTDAINDNIIRTFGNVDLQSLIGDPADQYSASYKSLDSLNNLYWTSYAYSYNVNSFVDFVRNLLEPLFKQAKSLIPARAKLLSGIVHEPHILERSKQIIVSPVEVTAGTLTKRHQTDTYNLEADPVTSQPNQIESAWENQDVVFETTQEYVTRADRLDKDAVLIVQSSSMAIHSDYLVLDDYSNMIAYKAGLLKAYGVVDPSQLSPFQLGQFGEKVQNFRSTLAINISKDYIAPAKTAQGTGSQALFQEILPITDFTKYEAFTYFQDPNGLFAIPKFIQVRQKQNILVDRGTWAAGTIYNRNDFVLQSGSVSGSDGNGKEFVCVSPKQTFTSNFPPFLDTTNWRAMTYTSVMVEDIKMAAVISGSVSLVPTGSTFPVAVGYQPTHYKFTRDKRRGIIRHQYLGCKFATGSNGAWDTYDGKPPVEVFYTTGNELVVKNPGDPIQPTNNPTGPILDVK
jgi:hypothetical protein